MADTRAVMLFESVYRRTDKQIRDLLEEALRDFRGGQAGIEIDTINVIIGTGVEVIGAGIAAVIRVDFQSVITGIFFQEFDGTTGSIRIDVQRSQGSNAPVWARISPVAQPGITDGRYSADEDVIGWLPTIDRGDYLRFVVATASDFLRVHVGLRIRRLEP